MNCANHSDREKAAFCQNCGKPLCQECTRVVGQAVYCEPCLAAKLAAAPVPPPVSAPGAYSYSNPASGITASGTSAGGAYTYTDPASGVYASGVIPPQPAHGAPNPLLAGFLGFIPGVGAMYNEQYVKGGVHLIVFVVLVSLANSNGIFGLFVAGWEFYMAFEAYHTARCRRDGLPLPNPFGLNDLGQKLGLDKAWHGTAAAAPLPPDPYTAQAVSAPAGAAPYPPPYTPSGTAPFTSPYSAGAVPPSWAAPPAWEQYNPSVPPPQVPLDAQVPYPGNRFPSGAIWLIGLGAIFLLFNAGFMHGVSGRLFLPILLMGLAVFIFVRKMTCDGYSLTGDGTPDYRLRIFRALRGSVWLALVGLLFFLDEFHILTWDHSWPLFIILAGVMTFMKRAVYSSAAVPPYMPNYAPAYGYPPQPAAPAATAPATPAEIIPAQPIKTSVTTNDQEGS